MIPAHSHPHPRSTSHTHFVCTRCRTGVGVGAIRNQKNKEGWGGVVVERKRRGWIGRVVGKFARRWVEQRWRWCCRVGRRRSTDPRHARCAGVRGRRERAGWRDSVGAVVRELRSRLLSAGCGGRRLSGRPETGPITRSPVIQGAYGVGKPMAQAPPWTTDARVIETPQADRRDTTHHALQPRLHYGRAEQPEAATGGQPPGPPPSAGARRSQRGVGADPAAGRSTATPQHPYQLLSCYRSSLGW